jgi:hypothetical protein
MSDRPENQRVVGVFPDKATAEEAAREAQQAGGRDVRVGAPEDEVSSLLGEMREETEQAWAGPGVGVYTKEMARSVPKWTALVPSSAPSSPWRSTSCGSAIWRSAPAW